MHHSNTVSRFRVPNSYNEAMRKRTRSTSSGCFLDTIEPETPTPPPPPLVMGSVPPGLYPPPAGTLPRPRSTSSGGFWQPKPKYKFNRIDNPVTDFTSAGSPPVTPVPSIPTPPPPPPPHLPIATSKLLKSSSTFGMGGYKNKPNLMLWNSMSPKRTKINLKKKNSPINDDADGNCEKIMPNFAKN